MPLDYPNSPNASTDDPLSYHRVFESLPGPYLLLSTELIVHAASEDFLRATGRRREEIKGHPAREVLAGPDGPYETGAAAQLEASLQRVLATRQSHQMEPLPVATPGPSLTGGSSRRYWQPTHTPVPDENGTLTGIIHRADDVTVRVQAQGEGQAGAQPELLRNLFAQAPALIAIVRGPAYVYELVNPLYQELFPNRQLVGRPLLEAVPEIAGQPIMDILDGVYRQGEPFTGNEMPIPLDRAGNGRPETFYFNFTYQPLRNAQGEVDGIISYAYDVTTQVLSRRRVEESEQRFRTLLESIPEMAWTAGPDGQINYYNSQWYAYTGQPEAQAVGTGWAAVTHPDDVTTCLPLWQRALATGTLYEAECRYQRAADGAWRWHLTRAVPQQDAAGRVVQWVGTCTDIHEQKRYAQQLLERETYFRRMTDSVPVMVWVTDPDGAGIYLNKPWYDYTGQTEEEALGLGWLSATHPGDAAQSREIFLAANAQRVPFSLLYRLRRHDGAYRWFLDKGEPRYNAAGDYEGYAGVVIDVHEQRRAEEQLLLSVRAGRVGIWEWDVVHDRATYSDLLQEMFGFPAGTFKGEFDGAYRIYQSVIHPDDRQMVNEQVQEAFRLVQREFYVEFRVLRPSGEITWIAERGEVVYEGDQPVRMNGTCIDITSRKRTEEAAHRLSEELAAVNEELAASNEELRAANEEIQASNEELTEANGQLARVNADLDNFVYTASHDLKAPILNVEGLLKALERQLSGEIRQKEIVGQLYQMLYASVARFRKTINDLTEVARIGKESQEDVAIIPLADVLTEVRQDLEPQIREAGALIEENLTCPAVRFSRKNLKSILYNLVGNAVKYRSPDRPPHVRLTCYTQDGYYVLTVADNGLGMDMSQEDKIFALFKRLHAHVEGTGIGLYIVKRVIENAGGRIEVESQVGVGSTFRVFLKR
jgi:PAS domain S-box-containing protein